MGLSYSFVHLFAYSSFSAIESIWTKFRGTVLYVAMIPVLMSLTLASLYHFFAFIFADSSAKTHDKQ